mmetsp:Transcript_17984/g.39220  ORF Transcript_17984/g.39220 Transcript_17984/m.39220 type:complete len:206 (+) Transcript_17984:132-749(+)|eukprot:CAMPEP_0168181608 /NCGR_PEP_ID=MMETSP0139_2-20121125/11350_1 /TAXON_ID=44445 /ORGANISM="Pseudo-nitzschia australis, Strain 10249 10 AB" /LENGTH=205 /DNA_ID=CAMNT_0008102281 /DNA_START=81 /DNA_END=695 /DNA_ORIENTATION=+
MKTSPVVIICPGNGCSDVRNSNWYGRLFNELCNRDIGCVCENFPDPLHARRDRWVPHVRSLAEQHGPSGCPENIVLVGHSSGAQAALRYAELYPVHACILVSATYSDLGDAHERASGYYPQKQQQQRTGDKELATEINPYDFSKMKMNCKTWHQFHSDDDPFIPVHEAQAIQRGLDLDDTFYLLRGRSHFFDFQQEILDSVLSVC